MNRPIQRVAIVVILLIVALLLNATYVQVIQADELRSDSRNSRARLDEVDRQRGMITAGNDVLALSEEVGDRLRYLRVYPTDPEVFAPVTGFYSVQYASTGLEETENSILNGNDDQLFGQRFSDLFSGREPRGGNVVTTIDPDLQRLAYQQMQNGCSGGCRGSVVALEPSTGKILTLVSTPSYDPNLLASHDPAVREEAYTRWRDSQYSPLSNRAISELYPPGSTYKVITTATALRDGIGTGERLTGAASYTLPGTATELTNYGGQVCPGGRDGTVSLEDAFKYSCNTAFVQLTTDRMNEPFDAMRDTAVGFGLDEQMPGIPLAVATSKLGPLNNLAELGVSSIGQQDVRMTPLLNAVVAATVANGGVRMQPYLVDSLQTADLNPISQTRPETVNSPLTPEQAATLTNLMIESERNTQGADGRNAIASKTGTAEHGGGPGSTPYSWYIAFGPSSNAKIAVAVFVENGDLGAGSTGGAVAAPIGRAVINAYVGGDR